MRPAPLNRPTPLALAPFALVLMAMAAFASPPAARAQEVISTAAHAPEGGAPPMASSGALRINDGLEDGPGFLRPAGPCGGPAKTPDGKTDKTPHGAVWAGAGTRGYREVGGAVCMPVGDHAAVSIAIDAGRINGRRR